MAWLRPSKPLTTKLRSTAPSSRMSTPRRLASAPLRSTTKLNRHSRGSLRPTSSEKQLTSCLLASTNTWTADCVSTTRKVRPSTPPTASSFGK